MRFIIKDKTNDRIYIMVNNDRGKDIFVKQLNELFINYNVPVEIERGW